MLGRLLAHTIINLCFEDCCLEWSGEIEPCTQPSRVNFRRFSEHESESMRKTHPDDLQRCDRVRDDRRYGKKAFTALVSAKLKVFYEVSWL